MKKVLFVSHLANFVKFNAPFMKWFQEQGWEVHYASLDEEELPYCDRHFKVDFERSPYKLKNIKAYHQLKTVIKNENYDLIHCHTPIGGFLTRMAAASCHAGPVLYTPHGFHFYKGAPKFRHFIYRTVEKEMAKRTDAIITINKEDYQSAQEFRLRPHGKVFHINGVGIDVNKIKNSRPDVYEIKAKIGIPKDAFVVITVAELIMRKNYPTALRAFKEADIPNSVYVICGDGVLEEQIKKTAQDLGLDGRVFFIGYDRKIYKTIHIGDVFLFTSFQEGLPVAVMEAMAAGLPVLASDIRGNNELIHENENGLLFNPNDSMGFADGLKKLYADKELRRKMGETAAIYADNYSVEAAVDTMAEIYRQYM